MQNVSRFSVVLWVIAVVFAVVFFAGAFPRFNQNDFMYVVAPTFLSDAQLYVDVPFMQAPLTAHLFYGVANLVEPAHLYFALRVLSLGFVASTAALGALIVLAVAGRLAVPLFLIMFFSSYQLAYISWEVANYSTALLFVFAAAYIYFARRHQPGPWFLIGLFIGLAATAKLNHALFAVPFAAFLLIPHRPDRVRNLIAFGGGGIVGASPLLYHAVSNMSAFYFFNLKVHHLVNLFRDESMKGMLTGIGDGSAELLTWYLPHILLIVAAAFWFSTKEARLRHYEFITLIITAYAVGVSPGIVFVQYFAPIAALICAGAAVSAHSIAKHARGHTRAMQTGWLAILLLWSVPYFALAALPGIRDMQRGNLAAVKLSDLSRRISVIEERHLTKRSCPRNAVTLSAIPFLGTGFQPTPFSASGSFLAQIHHIIEQQSPRFAHHSDVGRELERVNPAAILTGYFPKISAEKQLRSFAQNNRYVEFELGPFDTSEGMTLHVRMDCLVQRRPPGPSSSISR